MAIPVVRLSKRANQSRIAGSKKIIACNWSTPDYRDQALEQQENLRQYGIECVLLDQEVSSADRAVKTLNNMAAYYVTKDKAQMDFIRSCHGRYDKVLCLDTEVRMHKPLPQHWLSEDRSVLFQYEITDIPLSRGARSINIGQALWRTADYQLMQLAHDLSMAYPHGYDMEFHVMGACSQLKLLPCLEYYANARFCNKIIQAKHDLLEGYDYFFPFSKPHMVTTTGGIVSCHFSNVCAQATGGWIDEHTVFTHPALTIKKLLKPHKRAVKVDLMTVANLFSPTNPQLASMLYDWIFRFPVDHDQLLAAMRKQASVTQLGNLLDQLPANMAGFDFSPLKHRELYCINGWMICPGVPMVGLPGSWDSHAFYIYHLDSQYTKVKELQFPWLKGMAGLWDQGPTKH